jgi:hypothetical protein
MYIVTTATTGHRRDLPFLAGIAASIKGAVVTPAQQGALGGGADPCGVFLVERIPIPHVSNELFNERIVGGLVTNWGLHARDVAVICHAGCRSGWVSGFTSHDDLSLEVIACGKESGSPMLPIGHGC